MGIIDCMVIGCGLSMDACCIAVSNGMSAKNFGRKHIFISSLLFGLFQGIMPIIGYYAGSLFVHFFSQYSHLVVFMIFCCLGFKMIYDATLPLKETAVKSISLPILFTQAIATSMDALAVGVSLSAVGAPIFSSSMMIAGVTFLLTFIASLFGKKVGKFLHRKAGIIGGILLILIGLKVFWEGLM
jgi:putative Mn2+ efflux pump MntP